nr:MAG TPA: hypothetical protein [Caudoviricetes sp.]
MTRQRTGGYAAHPLRPSLNTALPPHPRGTPPDRRETEQDGNVPLRGHEERGPDNGVSEPPPERRSELLSGDGIRGAGHGPWPT